MEAEYQHTDTRLNVEEHLHITDSRLNTSSEERALEGECDVPESKPSVLYGTEDNPHPLLWPLFGLQQVITCMTGIITIPLLTCTIICVDAIPEVKSQLISLSVLTCGIGTILQNVIGVRLPIIQGASPNFLAAVISMMALSTWQCHTDESISLVVNDTSNMTWLLAVREIQGNLMLASLTQVFLGLTGSVGILLKFMGPLTIAPTIALIGFSLAPLLTTMCEVHWGISSATTLLVLIFSLFLGKYELPLPIYTRRKKFHIIRYPLFQVAPVLLSVVLMWIVCFSLTQTDMLPRNSTSPAYKARTNIGIHVVEEAPWIYFPFPGQFGTPTISVAGFVAMLAATIASIVESVGDYFSAARVSDSPPLPAHAVNRGIAIEGLGSFIGGCLGTLHGVTSYSENIGAIVVTKVASRQVFVTAGVMLTIFGVFGKFGALVTLIPMPIIGGVATVSFGMVAAVGLSTLQFVDLSSSRNLTVLALAMILGLALPHWLTTHRGAIQTGSEEIDHVLGVIMGAHMVVGCLVGFILDNLAPGIMSA